MCVLLLRSFSHALTHFQQSRPCVFVCVVCVYTQGCTQLSTQLVQAALSVQASQGRCGRQPASPDPQRHTHTPAPRAHAHHRRGQRRALSRAVRHDDRVRRRLQRAHLPRLHSCALPSFPQPLRIPPPRQSNRQQRSKQPTDHDRGHQQRFEFKHEFEYESKSESGVDAGGACLTVAGGWGGWRVAWGCGWHAGCWGTWGWGRWAVQYGRKVPWRCDGVRTQPTGARVCVLCLSVFALTLHA